MKRYSSLIVFSIIKYSGNTHDIRLVYQLIIIFVVLIELDFFIFNNGTHYILLELCTLSVDIFLFRQLIHILSTSLILRWFVLSYWVISSMVLVGIINYFLLIGIPIFLIVDTKVIANRVLRLLILDQKLFFLFLFIEIVIKYLRIFDIKLYFNLRRRADHQFFIIIAISSVCHALLIQCDWSLYQRLLKFRNVFFLLLIPLLY